MSTVKADNFTWKTGQATGQSGTNVTGDQIVYGVSKVWCNYSGTSTTVNRGYNISSVTKSATARYVFYFSTSLPDANYSLSGSAQRNASDFTHLHFGPYGPSSLTLSSAECITPYNSGSTSGDVSYADAYFCMMTVNR